MILRGGSGIWATPGVIESWGQGTPGGALDRHKPQDGDCDVSIIVLVFWCSVLLLCLLGMCVALFMTCVKVKDLENDLQEVGAVPRERSWCSLPSCLWRSWWDDDPFLLKDKEDPAPLKISPGRRLDKLKEIEGRQRIQLDREQRQLRITGGALRFKAVSPNAPGSNVSFEDVDKAKRALADVAEILKLFERSMLQVEGHIATAGERMGEWARNLGLQQANLVKETLGSMGADVARVSVVSKPGPYGNNRQEVLLNFLHIE